MVGHDSCNFKKIALIGVGGIGFRHFQGLLKIKKKYEIYLVDKSLEALEKARDESVLEMNNGVHDLFFLQDISKLPKFLNFVIIATSANNRVKLISDLLKVSTFPYLIVEKFLFNNSSDYEVASGLINSNDVKVWVNMPRRLFPIYQELHKNSYQNSLRSVLVQGGDWGMCCNSVHFLDLVQFLTGVNDISIIDSSFDAEIISSKRDGYLELTGSLRCQVGEVSVELQSIKNSKKQITICLSYVDKTIFIAEQSELYVEIANNEVKIQKLHLPFQSELTGSLADQILTSGSCDLVVYEESSLAHIPLLFEFSKYAGQIINGNAHCAIT